MLRYEGWVVEREKKGFIFHKDIAWTADFDLLARFELIEFALLD